MLLTVVTAAKSPGISSGLTYESPEDLPNGSIVEVPLRSKYLEGIVTGSKRPKGDFDVKSIKSALYKEPLLTPQHIRTMQWMSEYYLCTQRQALKVFLPPIPWSSVLPKNITHYNICSTQVVKGRHQQAIIDFLSVKNKATWDEIRESLGVSKASLTSLVQKGIIEERTSLEYSASDSIKNLVVKRPTLSNDQNTVYEEISTSTKPCLLFGVTGSGKTEVYANLIADMCEQEKQSIVLVPEILLTQSTVARLSQLIDRTHIAVLHSGLTAAQKREEWKRIRFGDVKLIIGSRSALFAPVTNLGLIVIDEEHEWTYKNEQTPRYHTRETAEVLCKEFDATLVLGSATPSIESWHKAKQGIYILSRLEKRYKDAPMPFVKVVDLAQVHFGNNYPFSNTLIESIRDRLEKKEQSVLFLNRRGIATSLLCMECRRRIVSPESNLPFTVHQSGQTLYLQDHTTGATAKVPDACPACKSTKLQTIGAGTQGVEATLSRLFPNAKLLRADSDTLTHPDQIKELLEKMEEHEADILLGTQSVVKGLDLPNVTLAAVLVADIGLSMPHFRAGERVFQLLTQLTGRSGRAKPGEVIIQTFRPDSPEVKAAALHDAETYIERELQIRISSNYPPATDLIRFLFRGQHAKQNAMHAKHKLEELSTNQDITASPTLFGAGKTWHVFIRGDGARALLSKVNFQDAVVDVDPMDCA